MPACTACGASNAADARFCSGCGVSLAPDPAAPTRKTVTVLHCDLSGFTPLGERLDPESLHEVMARYFKAMRGVIERHGGRVEKYIGDAILAVFGVPQLHEDDAVRAARCALQMRDALIQLNPELESGWGVTLHARYGLSTGEVAIARVGAHPFFLLGDAVNVAQRLEAAAPADEVLVGPQTARLLDGVAQLAPLEPLLLKGKAAPVVASRLLSMPPPGDAARGASTGRMVGRERELQSLHAALDEAVAQRRCRLVTVVGPAGIGKSCLVRTFMTEAEETASVVLGRCLSYGEGITFWPVTEVVKQIAGRADEAAIAAVVADDEETERVTERVARAIGIAAGTAPIEEIQWAVRRLLEAAARRRPLVVVVEDIHWAEPTLLDLLEHVARQANDVPLLLVCLTRPEPLEWQLTSSEMAEVPVGPLSERQSGDLLEQLDPAAVLDAAERGRLLAAAEGNPFFLEQMVAMRQETGPEASVPATIQAVLSARIDALPPSERAVMDCAAVEGRRFHRRVVAELLPSQPGHLLEEALGSLVRRDLIRPGQPDLLGEDGYRFSHILVRDAIYELLPKARRADLHERFGRWLAARSVTDRDDSDIIGFHLEQAHRWRTDLQPLRTADHRRLAEDGAHHLGTAGRAARGRGDLPAAAKLLQRAARLLDDDAPALGSLLPELGDVLTQAGHLHDGERVLERAVGRASERGESLHEAHARVCLLFAQLQTTPGTADEVLRRFPALRATFEADDDALGLDRLLRLRALVHWLEARSAAADRDWKAAVKHARRADDKVGIAESLGWLASSALAGPTPALTGIARCEAMLGELRGNRRAEASVMEPLAALRAMRGEFAIAYELLARSNAMFADLGVTLHTAVAYFKAVVDLLADDPAMAEASLRDGYDLLRDMGEKALLADTAITLARAVCAQGRFAEALDLTGEAEAAADEHDISVQVGWRTVRAAVLVRRGELQEAKRLAAEAVLLVKTTDWLSDQADALVTWAEVLTACGDHSAAGEAMLSALALHEQKGNLVAAERVRTALALDAPA